MRKIKINRLLDMLICLNYNEFLKDPDIYNQIFNLFLDEEELKKWYKNTYKDDLRLKKIERIIFD